MDREKKCLKCVLRSKYPKKQHLKILFFFSMKKFGLCNFSETRCPVPTKNTGHSGHFTGLYRTYRTLQDIQDLQDCGMPEYNQMQGWK